jgi:hypothetical protein
LAPVNAVRVPWSSASFLVYLGGLTILFATFLLLNVQSEDHGAGGFVLWALLILVALAALAFLARRHGRLVTAGVLALSVVAAFVVFLGALFDWFGWLASIDNPGFKGFHVSLLLLELATVIAATAAWRGFRFPLLVFVIAVASWYFTTDLISNGGDWSAIVTIAIGLVLLVAAVAADPVPAFWLHVSAGIAIGGGLLWFFHDSDFDWILIAIVALLYIALGDRLMRSSWAVLAAWGFLQVTTHFAEKWSDLGFLAYFFLFPFFGGDDYRESYEHMWAGPLAYAVVGLFFIGIALFLARRRRDVIPAAELI